MVVIHGTAYEAQIGHGERVVRGHVPADAPARRDRVAAGEPAGAPVARLALIVAAIFAFGAAGKVSVAVKESGPGVVAAARAVATVAATSVR